MPDVIASNGVIHTISRVLFPPPIFETVDDSSVDSLELELELAPMAETVPRLPMSPDSEATGAKTTSSPPKPKLILGLKNNDE